MTVTRDDEGILIVFQAGEKAQACRAITASLVGNCEPDLMHFAAVGIEINRMRSSGMMRLHRTEDHCRVILTDCFGVEKFTKEYARKISEK